VWRRIVRRQNAAARAKVPLNCDMLDRSALRARAYRLGEEPRDDLSICTSADERLALVAELTREMWALAGLRVPMYSRAQMPVAIVHRDIREK